MTRYISRDGAILTQNKGSQIVHVYYKTGQHKTVIGQLTKDSVESIVLYGMQPEGVKRIKEDNV